MKSVNYKTYRQYRIKKGIDTKLRPETQHDMRNMTASKKLTLRLRWSSMTSYSTSKFSLDLERSGNRIPLNTQYNSMYFTFIYPCFEARPLFAPKSISIFA